ncbi:MAG: MFS transporter [Pseudomonadota bacterium]
MATVTIGITVFAVAQGLTYPLISLLLAGRGASETVVGLNAAAFMLGLAVSVLVAPALTKHLRAGQVIVAGLAGAAITLIGFAVTDVLAVWFLLRFVLGFCVNAIYVFGEAWLNAASADRVRGRVAGIYSAGMTLGFVIGPLAIPVFGTEDGLAFAACAVLISLAAFGLGIMSRRAKIEPDKLALADLPRFALAAPLLILLVLAFGFVDTTVLSLAPLHMLDGGASTAAAAIFIAVMHIGMIVAQPLLGVLLDRTDCWCVATGCLGVLNVTEN